jgi:RNA polymerase sigma-70 factor (ECF subfamily)
LFHPVHDAHTSTLLQNYIAAIRERNLPKLEALLAEDIAFYADGGSKINVVRKVCTGAAAVAEVITYAFHTYQSKATIKPAIINHQPAFLFFSRDHLFSCMVFDIAGDHILRINTIVDPEKLKNLIQTH